MASGYGRGGRGAALMQALNTQVRRPGQEAPANGSTQPQQQGPTPTAAAPAKPIGRGAMLALLMQQQRPQQPAAEPVRTPVTAAATQQAAPARQQPLPSAPARQQQRPQQPAAEPVRAAAAAQQAALPRQQPLPSGRGYSQQMLPVGGRGAPIERPPPAPVKPTGRGAPIQAFGRGAPVADLPPAKPAAQADPELAKTAAPSAAGETQRRQTGLERMVEDLTINKSAVVRKGKSGVPIPITANYIAVRCKNDGVYQYHVSFSPAVDSRGMRFRMVNEHKDVIGQIKAFDGSSLFLPIKLPNVETLLTSERPTDGEQITVCIKLVRVLPPASCVQIYNIIFRRLMDILKMCQVGQHYYDPTRPARVPQHRLEVWPGYVTSIREYEGGLMLLTDVSHRVLRTETVLDLMHDIIQRNKQNFQDEITKKLVGCTVLTRYNNKTYRVDDIAWDKDPESTFTTSTGESISFQSYYKKAYNKEIQDSRQPLLLHRPKKRERMKTSLEVICLIPELSYATGLTDDMRSDFRVMKDLATHTRVTPMQRQIALRKFCENVNQNPEARAELDKWGLELDGETTELQARKIPIEKIRFKNGVVDAGMEADWGRATQKEHVISAVDLNHWMVLFTRRDANPAREFIKTMGQVCPSIGIKMNNPVIHELQNDRAETYLRAIRDNIDPRVQIVVTIFPTSRDDRYNALKKLTCSECPVASQVINAKTISQERKLRSVTQKIALQMNCKLGGELWAVDIPTDKLMVCGIDVYHEVSKAGRRSVAGFVASLNKLCTRWYSQVCHQTQGQELVDGLKICLTTALRKYHEVNHMLPDRIIVYRDGVGDGQLSVVANYEVSQLSDTFHHFGENYQPKLGVIVVQKRINTRIFARQQQRGQTQFSNPPPGTILDHTVTRREWYDFFLVSQHVRQGTVSPTHYIVVHDSTDWGVDHIQRLSYKLTHLYYNWPGTVRVPAPCQYAHRLAQLIGQNVRKDPSPELSDRLFYL